MNGWDTTGWKTGKASTPPDVPRGTKRQDQQQVTKTLIVTSQREGRQQGHHS